MKTLARATQAIHIGVGKDSATGAISYPIYPSATYRHPGVGQSTGFDYSRSGNPTRQTLEEGLAVLEGGVRGLAFSSGMAALTTLFLHFRTGDHIIASEDIYGGTYRLLTLVLGNLGLHISYVPTSDVAAVQAAIQPNTRALLVETPGNPLMGISDLAALGTLCRKHELMFIVDNTFMTPMLQRPFEFGADVVVHSATKYLGGHNDVCAGVLVARTAELGERLYFLQNSIGAVLSPQDCWLLLRSLKTLSLRMERHNQNAMQIAQWLEKQPAVKAVHYPGLPSHPQHALAQSQASGFGGMLSFRVRSAQMARKVLERLTLISFAESLGGVETLMTLPDIQTHGDIPREQKDRLGIDESLLRLSVGIEDVADIIADLEQAFAAAERDA